jgi:BirA family biotin operon repressor/biotin-[acetyl-CoA-carboxylase] ligase
VIALSSKGIDDLLIRGTFVSGEDVARKLGVSRTAIFKRIRVLRSAGYSIKSVQGKGYRLLPRFDGLLPLEIRTKSRSTIFGREITTLESVDSTQNYARKMADAGAPEGTVVVALEQKAGKGRMSRAWSSPKGGLWFTLLLRPLIPMRELYKLTLLFGVSVARALESYDLKPSLKWPNDVLVNGKKICGILMETSGEPDRVEYVLVGIGLNVNFSSCDLPNAIRSSSISMHDLLNRRMDRADLLSLILENSESLYLSAAKEGFQKIINAWRSMSCTTGRTVAVQSFGGSISGRAVDIDDDGSLIVETKEGRKKVYSGDVFFS